MHSETVPNAQNTQNISHINSNAQNTHHNNNNHNPSEITSNTLMVIRRNGTLVPFDSTRIAAAITKAFWDVEGTGAEASARITEIVHSLTEEVSETFKRRIAVTGRTIHIEDIQDQVELALMRNQYHQVARSYVIYREEHRRQREVTQQQKKADAGGLSIVLEDGSSTILDIQALEASVSEACHGLSEVTPTNIVRDAVRNLFNGVHVREVRQALIMAARTFIEQEPNYSYVAARLLLKNLQLEASRFLKLPLPENSAEMAKQYAATLAATIHKGVELDLLDRRLKTFNLEKLGQAILPDRDLQFTYLGLQTLYDRYFLHNQGIRFELPQTFFMRVAMGLALKEKDKDHWAVEFYRSAVFF